MLSSIPHLADVHCIQRICTSSNMATHKTDEDYWFDIGIITSVVVRVMLYSEVLLK